MIDMIIKYDRNNIKYIGNKQKQIKNSLHDKKRQIFGKQKISRELPTYFLRLALYFIKFYRFDYVL